ncbi:terpene cyclase [Streptomyces sp. B6B3]|uniref:terpene synthase family protein n=1 Tax=Streptomyces sp. B6B3 TaxID=3153570 RepID=UPI00325D9F41
MRPGHDGPRGEATAGEELRAWAGRFRLLADDAHRATLTTARPAHIAVRLFPVAEPRVLALAAQWLAVNFLVDDLLDTEDDPARCDAVAAALLRAADGAAPPAAAPLGRALADLWHRTTAGRSSGWCRTFRADLASWLGTYAREARDRLAGRVPETDAYRRHRRLSSGMLVFVGLVEPAVGVDLPDEVRGDPAVAALRGLTAEHMGLVNDLYSVDRELASGQVHNAASVIMHHTGVGRAEALRRVVGLTTDCQRAFQEATRSPAAADSSVRRCVRGYRALMRGAVDICQELDRYAHPALTTPGGTQA